MNRLTLENKNARYRVDVESTSLAQFLEDKIISLLEASEQCIHKRDLANAFSQKIRFQSTHLWSVVEILIAKGIIHRSNRSAYFCLDKDWREKYGH